MKTRISLTSTLVFILGTACSLWGQKDNKATFENYLKTVYTAYEKGGFEDLQAYYAPNVTDISPDGNMTIGLDALKAGYAEFEKMMDTKPKFTYNMTSWSLITPDVALVTWDSVDEFQIQGQKIEGHNTCAAVLHKVDGKWLIAFSQLTPKITMPMSDPAGN